MFAAYFSINYMYMYICHLSQHMVMTSNGVSSIFVNILVPGARIHEKVWVVAGHISNY